MVEALIGIILGIVLLGVLMAGVVEYLAAEEETSVEEHLAEIRSIMKEKK